MTWSLLDAAVQPEETLQAIRLAMRDQPPPPCEAPTPDGLASLGAGDRVFLQFKTTEFVMPPTDAATGQVLPWSFGSEGMWVQIIKRMSPGSFMGLLTSRPMAISELQLHSRVPFNIRNVIVFRKTVGLRSWIYRSLAWLS